MKKSKKLWKYLVKCGKMEGINLRSDSLKYTFDFKEIGKSIDFCTVKALPHIERTVDEGDYLTLMMHKNNCDGFFIAVFERK